MCILFSLMRKRFQSGLHLVASGSFLFLFLWKGAGLRSAHMLWITMKMQLLLYFREWRQIYGVFSSYGFKRGEKTQIHGEFSHQIRFWCGWGTDASQQLSGLERTAICNYQKVLATLASN